MKALITALLLAVANPAMAFYCNPRDNTTRVLDAPAPNAIHPDWRGESYLGTGWTLSVRKTVTVHGFRFYRGDLLSTRGGVINRNVYGLVKEWECSL